MLNPENAKRLVRTEKRDKLRKRTYLCHITQEEIFTQARWTCHIHFVGVKWKWWPVKEIIKKPVSSNRWYVTGVPVPRQTTTRSLSWTASTTAARSNSSQNSSSQPGVVLKRSRNVSTFDFRRSRSFGTEGSDLVGAAPSETFTNWLENPIQPVLGRNSLTFPALRRGLWTMLCPGPFWARELRLKMWHLMAPNTVKQMNLLSSAMSLSPS